MYCTIIVTSHHRATAIGANRLEHKELYDIITDEEWYILFSCGNVIPLTAFCFGITISPHL